MSILPFDQREGSIWFDGHIVPWKEAKVHVLTHGLHYGSSIFEGERAYNGRIFKCREHSDRFIRSANLIDMAMPYLAEQLDSAKYDVLKANGFTNAYLRPVAWRGSEQMGIGARQTTHGGDEPT